MDSWKGRKRPWEDDHPSDFRNTRRDSNVVVGDDPVPPLPQHAGWYARDSQGLGQRRLPPLYTPTCISSAEPLVVDTPRPSPSFFETTGHDGLRPRSHSVVDVSQSKRQRLEDFQGKTLVFRVSPSHDPRGSTMSMIGSVVFVLVKILSVNMISQKHYSVVAKIDYRTLTRPL